MVGWLGGGGLGGADVWVGGVGGGGLGRDGGGCGDGGVCLAGLMVVGW